MPDQPEKRFRATFDTADPAFRKVLKLAARSAPAGASILISGPTGSGKSRLARAIHEESRVSGDFVHVDCSAIPSDLFEAELFGYEKGAYTGAAERKSGLIETAAEGTLYLDRVHDLPAEVQPKLLRFAEDGSYRRIGGIAELRLRSRIIASIDAAAEVASIRPDLLFRLDVVRLEIPPLAARLGDVRLLAEKFVQIGSSGKSSLSKEALARLESYHWPGNVRELSNVLHRAMIVAGGGVIGAADIELEIEEEDLVALHVARRATLEELERSYIAQILHETGRNYSRAAAILGINRKTLLEKRKRYGLDE